MPEWTDTTWGELSRLRYGKALRGYKDGVGPVEVFGTNGPIGWTDEQLFPPGIVVGRKGAYRGIHYAKGPCWVIDTAFWLELPNPDAVSPRWAYWQLRTVDLDSIDSGSAIPSTSRDAFAQIPVRLPPLATQVASAALLDSLDDLIENNRRRVELLEEMARAIYREWFVHFRFPGHDDAALVDSVLGPIPEGWSAGVLQDLSASLVDGDWIETKDQGGSDYRLLQVSNVGLGSFRETGKFRFITQQTFERLRCTEIEVGDILISRMPDPVGRAWLVDELDNRAVTAVDVAILTPRSEAAGAYLAQMLNSPEQLAQAETMATGTTRKRITRRVLAASPTVLPTDEMLHRYAEATSDGRGLVRALNQATRSLETMRNLLLPKLVTGQIDVSDLDLDAVAEKAGV